MSKYPTVALTGYSPEQLAWMAGHWQGHHEKDQVEEQWADPAGGALMGMFRWLKEDRIWFYEFMTIEQAEEGVKLRIKHFYPGLKGWEEKDEATEFLLVQAEGNKATFLQVNKPGPWLTYHLEHENQLVSFFEKEDEESSPESRFVFQRQL